MTDLSFWQVIRERRSVRRYRSEPVPRDLVERVLEAARWAPSAHNRQPWRFAVLPRGPLREELVQRMGEQWARDLRADGWEEADIAARVSRSQTRLLDAPVLILVALSREDMDTYPDPRRQEAEYIMAVQSTAMAGQNLLLAAHALGLGACWVCAPLFVPELVRDILQLPEDWIAQGFITLGYPAEQPQKDRIPLDERVIWLNGTP
ncbi:MAG: nitroreductase family protein [Chloroflexi bacterium]|nr:nitroreductase family protein [Chloroflexota bacterium]